MTVDANSSPPIHHRKKGMGLCLAAGSWLAKAIYLCQVQISLIRRMRTFHLGRISIIALQLADKLLATRYIGYGFDSLCLAPVGEGRGQHAILKFSEVRDKLVGKTELASRPVIVTIPFTPVDALHLKQRLEHYFAFQNEEAKIGLSETMGACFL